MDRLTAMGAPRVDRVPPLRGSPYQHRSLSVSGCQGVVKRIAVQRSFFISTVYTSYIIWDKIFTGKILKS